MTRAPGRGHSHPGLDAYRGASVVLMYVVHARRLQPGASRSDTGPLERALDLVMWAEPFIAASFLFIVGYSLVLAHDRHPSPSAFRSRVIRRAIELFVLSALLFVPHYGLQWPDGLLSSGILSAIAVALVSVGLALGAARPATSLALLAGGVLAVTAALDHARVTVSGLNGGPGGAFPIIAFAAAGALTALSEQRAGTRALGRIAAAAAPVLFVVLVVGGAWTTTHVSVYADYGSVAGPALLGLRPTALVSVPFWNHSTLGVLGLLAPLGMSLLVFVAPQHRVAGWPPVRGLALLGRHALAAYVGHLVVLGTLATAGITPPSARWTWALIAMLTAAAGLLSAGWERVRARRARTAQMGPGSRADG